MRVDGSAATGPVLRSGGGTWCPRPAWLCFPPRGVSCSQCFSSLPPAHHRVPVGVSRRYGPELMCSVSVLSASQDGQKGELAAVTVWLCTNVSAAEETGTKLTLLSVPLLS